MGTWEHAGQEAPSGAVAANGGVAEPVISEDDAINGVVLGPDGYIYVPPPPSKQLTINMQVSVTECTTWQTVLAAVDQNGDLFDYRNTATAIHRVARYGQEESRAVMAHPVFPRLLALLRAKIKYFTARALSDASWGLAKLGCREDELFRRISVRAREILSEMDPQGLALVSWSFATIGRRDDELMTAIAEQSRKRMSEFGPQNIANLVWATATLGFKCDPLHAAIEQQSLRGLDDFTTQELAMVNWALTKIAYRIGDAWKTSFRRRVMQLKDYAPSELSMLAWALATRGEYDPDQMAYIARRSIELMRSFTGQNLATVIWAIGTVSYKDDPCIDEFLRMALGAIIARANEFQPLNIALISWGLAKIAYRAEVAFDAMADAALAQIDNFAPQNMVQLLWACGTAGYRHEELLQGAGRVAKQRFHEFSSQHLSNFIWACARLAYSDDTDLLQRFNAEAIKRMNEGSPQHLSNIAWAVGQLGKEHFPGCLRAIVAETNRRVHDFDPPSLMMLSDSLFEAGYNDPNEPLLGVLRGHVMRMGQELYSVLTEGLPVPKSSCSQSSIAEYQRRLRGVGLVTFGYEHTNGLFSKLGLADGPRWEPAEAFALPGWTTNARRTTAARRYRIAVGPAMLEDAGSIFTSAFASPAEDNACELVVTWLGQGKADSPNVGRAGRSGDAECRAFCDTHGQLRKAIEDNGTADVTGWISFHTSGVPCLSCVGVAAQFKRLYPRLQVHFTFTPREHGFGADNDMQAAGPLTARGERSQQSRQQQYGGAAPAAAPQQCGCGAHGYAAGNGAAAVAGYAAPAAPVAAPAVQAQSFAGGGSFY